MATIIAVFLVTPIYSNLYCQSVHCPQVAPNVLPIAAVRVQMHLV